MNQGKFCFATDSVANLTASDDAGIYLKRSEQCSPDSRFEVSCVRTTYIA